MRDMAIDKRHVAGIVGVAFAVVATARPAFAANNATASGSATVLRTIAISETNSGLDFGKVVEGASTGSVTVSTASAWSSTGGVYKIGSSETSSAAAFQVTGEGGQTISVTIGALTLNGHAVSLTNDLPATPALSNSAGTGGTLTFHVGGTVSVNNGDPTGTKTGTFSVAVDYN
jgi:uncharacterized protein DUF4402